MVFQHAAPAWLLALTIGVLGLAPLPARAGWLSPLSTAGAKGEGESPWFCRQKDCPRFEVVEHTSDWELRSYDAVSFVNYNSSGLKFEFAMGKAFTSLYRYFSGSNDDGVKMPLTTPYLTSMALKGGSTAETTREYTIGLMLPFQQQGSPPAPTLDTLQVEHCARASYFVAIVPGYATEGSFLEAYNRLRAALRAAGRSDDFEEGRFLAAVYDPPTKLTGRYNEVAIPAKSPGAARAQ